MKKIFRFFRHVGDWVAWLFGVWATYQCGHRGARRFAITLFNENLGRFSDPDLDRERCPVCTLEHLEKVSIRCACADCGLPILPHDVISVEVPNTGVRLGPWAHRTGELVVFGGCCMSHGDFSGHWGDERHPLPALDEEPEQYPAA